jgi:heavy metal sensor kinase
MKKPSIGMRLTLWYLAIFVVAQLVFGAGMWFMLRHHLDGLVEDGLEDQIDDLRTLLQNQGHDPVFASLQKEVSEAYASEHLGNYLEVMTGNGEIVYRSEFLAEHPANLAPREQVDKATFSDRWLERRPYRFLAEKLEVNGHLYVVTMGAPNDDVVETLAQFREYLLMFAPLLLLVAAAGGYWLSRRALAPVDEVVRTARDISGANLHSRLPKLDTGDELQRLSDTLNQMLARIEAAFLRVTEFTADASHELRTPVSLIRTEAELALRRSRGEAEYKESLRHILLEAERTTVLIEELLSLARADAGREMLLMQPVDLCGTLQEVVESWRQVATIRNLEFSSNIPQQDLFVLGDTSALRQVANILLDNAFKYTSSPGNVSLTLELKAVNVAVVVRDSGIGIAKEDQSRIFERFYRVDKARSRAQGGVGLGLSIARWIVLQHHGIIEVESRLGEGSAFRVELPIIPAPVANPLVA